LFLQEVEALSPLARHNVWWAEFCETVSAGMLESIIFLLQHGRSVHFFSTLTFDLMIPFDLQKHASASSQGDNRDFERLMKNRPFYGLLVFSVLLLIADVIATGKVFAGSDPFPVYECLKPNVAFWKTVYTRYSTQQGILHDSENVSVIYGVIDLVDQQKPNARKINEVRVAESKRKYEAILEKLARGELPSSPEESRVAALFGSNASRSDFVNAKENLRCQIGQMDRFQEGLVRSGAFLGQIKQIFESHGLPADLAYLPHVESSFNYDAYSRFGAAGIWQFMPSTGKRFMKIGYAVDERKDPIRSSHAAVKLLKENYEVLGDWPVAITAYNHGVSGMLRAKQSLGSYEEIFRKYEGSSFKFASRNFYAEFLAARDVAKNYQQYFGEMKLEKPAEYHEIILANYLSMNDLVRNSNVDTRVIRSLNPALRESVYRNQKYIPKGYALRLPLVQGERPEVAALELSQRIYKSEQKRSLFYMVQRGDTARDVARMHGIELSQLILANNLNSRATIYAGQNLRIPAPDEKTESLLSASLTRDEAYSPVPIESDSATIGEPDSKAEVVVQQESPTPSAQEKIKPSEFPANPSVVTGDLVVKSVTKKNGRVTGVIRAEAEETLGHYADWLGISSQAIRKLNGWRNARMLRLHELVKIPLDKASKEDFEGKRFEYHKEMEEDFFASYRVESLKIYRIGDGDNIWKLCLEAFDVPFWLIVKYNPALDFTSLRPSQELFVPIVVGKS
jgi:membrane-bound lytic murein transglycosylase D